MDTVGQLLVEVKNGGAARHEKVDLPASKIRASLAKILMEQGLIRSFKVAKDSKQGIMRLYLKYDDRGRHVITDIVRVSKPSRRVYVKADEIPQVRSGLGFCILSTSKGLMNGKTAAEQKLGGELICKIW